MRKFCERGFRIREMQKYEFDMARQQDLNAKRQREEAERMQKQEEEKVIKEILMKEEARKNKKELLPPEASETDPNACEIAFRLPTGKRLVRRFLRTDTIEALYVYVSLSNDLADCTYEIAQAIPRKVYSNMNATLESEGLAPKAALQVVMVDVEDQ
jgi:FAS-associated factor 2